MKKFLLVIMLLFSVVSFAKWQKIYQKDDFGDSTNQYMIGTLLRENELAAVLIGHHEKTNQTAMVINFLGADFGPEKNIEIRIKGDDGEITPTPIGLVSGSYIVIRPEYSDNKKTRQLKIEKAFGDTRVRAGSLVVVNLNLGDTKVKNFMLVEKVTHVFRYEEHFMDLTLRGGEFVA